jgi:hypothetical protein
MLRATFIKFSALDIFHANSFPIHSRNCPCFSRALTSVRSRPICTMLRGNSAELLLRVGLIDLKPWRCPWAGSGACCRPACFLRGVRLPRLEVRARDGLRRRRRTQRHVRSVESPPQAFHAATRALVRLFGWASATFTQPHTNAPSFNEDIVIGNHRAALFALHAASLPAKTCCQYPVRWFSAWKKMTADAFRCELLVFLIPPGGGQDTESERLRERGAAR